MDCIDALTNHIIKRTYDEQIYRNLLQDVGYHNVKTLQTLTFTVMKDAHRLFLLLKINF